MDINEINERLENHFGEPVWEGHVQPLEILILTILSQSTSDHNRDMAYDRLIKRFPNWDDVMNTSAQDIADAIRPAGLGNQKSVRIKDVLIWIHETYNTFDLTFLGDMDPNQVMDTFLKLKGVGVKTISVVLMVACGVDIFPVDTHVHRISKRLHLVPQNATAEKTHHLMQPQVPEGKSFSLHMNFLALGRTICKAQKPLCQDCPLADLCPSNIFLKNKSN